MTTTQTGGGNGAAPDGVSERIVPDRAGWWWRMGSHGPYVVEVDDYYEGVLFAVADEVRDDNTWLAPIPGPAVLAALAEYGDALEFWRENKTPVAGGQASDALRLLDTAIRAERDGDA